MTVRLFLIAIALVVWTKSSEAQSFSNIFFFGDSSTDSGRYLYLPAVKGQPATTAPAGKGAFTTNPDPEWSVLLGQKFGIVITPSSAPGGGNNYAAGGARVVVTDPAKNAWSAKDQINDYLASTSNRADPNALYVVWIGYNDLTTQSNPNIVNPPNFNAIDELAGETVGLIRQLSNAGAKRIVVPNTLANFDVGIELGGSADVVRNAILARARYDQAIWNGLLAANVSFIMADVKSLINNLIANAAAQGITNIHITEPACNVPAGIIAYQCGPDNYVASDANRTHLFADGTGHLTGVAQKIIADYVYSRVQTLVQPSPNQIVRGIFSLGTWENSVSITSNADFLLHLWAINRATTRGLLSVQTPPSQFRGRGNNGPTDVQTLYIPGGSNQFILSIGAKANETIVLSNSEAPLDIFVTVITAPGATALMSSTPMHHTKR